MNIFCCLLTAASNLSYPSWHFWQDVYPTLSGSIRFCEHPVFDTVQSHSISITLHAQCIGCHLLHGSVGDLFEWDINAAWICITYTTCAIGHTTTGQSIMSQITCGYCSNLLDQIICVIIITSQILCIPYMLNCYSNVIDTWWNLACETVQTTWNKSPYFSDSMSTSVILLASLKQSGLCEHLSTTSILLLWTIQGRPCKSAL